MVPTFNCRCFVFNARMGFYAHSKNRKVIRQKILGCGPCERGNGSGTCVAPGRMEVMLLLCSVVTPCSCTVLHESFLGQIQAYRPEALASTSIKCSQFSGNHRVISYKNIKDMI